MLRLAVGVVLLWGETSGWTIRNAFSCFRGGYEEQNADGGERSGWRIRNPFSWLRGGYKELNTDGSVKFDQFRTDMVNPYYIFPGKKVPASKFAVKTNPFWKMASVPFEGEILQLRLLDPNKIALFEEADANKEMRIKVAVASTWRWYSTDSYVAASMNLPNCVMRSVPVMISNRKPETTWQRTEEAWQPDRKVKGISYRRMSRAEGMRHLTFIARLSDDKAVTCGNNLRNSEASIPILRMYPPDNSTGEVNCGVYQEPDTFRKKVRLYSPIAKWRKNPLLLEGVKVVDHSGRGVSRVDAVLTEGTPWCNANNIEQFHDGVVKIVSSERLSPLLEWVYN